MQIPHERLAPDTLRALIYDYVTRDGTDYGEREITADQKIAQVMHQLAKGLVVIVFDEESQGFDVLTREESARRQTLKEKSP